jgi:hypothetical protein
MTILVYCTIALDPASTITAAVGYSLQSARPKFVRNNSDDDNIPAILPELHGRRTYRTTHVPSSTQSSVSQTGSIAAATGTVTLTLLEIQSMCDIMIDEIGVGVAGPQLMRQLELAQSSLYARTNKDSNSQLSTAMPSSLRLSSLTHYTPSSSTSVAVTSSVSMNRHSSIEHPNGYSSTKPMSVANDDVPAITGIDNGDINGGSRMEQWRAKRSEKRRLSQLFAESWSGLRAPTPTPTTSSHISSISVTSNSTTPEPPTSSPIITSIAPPPHAPISVGMLHQHNPMRHRSLARRASLSADDFAAASAIPQSAFNVTSRLTANHDADLAASSSNDNNSNTAQSTVTSATPLRTHPNGVETEPLLRVTVTAIGSHDSTTSAPSGAPTVPASIVSNESKSIPVRRMIRAYAALYGSSNNNGSMSPSKGLSPRPPPPQHHSSATAHTRSTVMANTSSLSSFNNMSSINDDHDIIATATLLVDDDMNRSRARHRKRISQLSLASVDDITTLSTSTNDNGSSVTASWPDRYQRPHTTERMATVTIKITVEANMSESVFRSMFPNNVNVIEIKVANPLPTSSSSTTTKQLSDQYVAWLATVQYHASQISAESIARMVRKRLSSLSLSLPNAPTTPKSATTNATTTTPSPSSRIMNLPHRIKAMPSTSPTTSNPRNGHGNGIKRGSTIATTTLLSLS